MCHLGKKGGGRGEGKSSLGSGQGVRIWKAPKYPPPFFPPLLPAVAVAVFECKWQLTYQTAEQNIAPVEKSHLALLEVLP